MTQQRTSLHDPERRALMGRALSAAAAALVHATALPASVGAQTRHGRDSRAKASGSKPVDKIPTIITGHGLEGLPPAVVDMRAAILDAVDTGDIAEIKGAMDLNELPPDVGALPGADPIEHLRSMSRDGSGSDVLGAIEKLLAGTWAAIPGGRDIENNRIYVWPRFAEILPGGPQDPDRAALVDLVGEERARAMLETRTYTGWRLSIGADGVWHVLHRVGP
jgi:hypothetical protein